MVSSEKLVIYWCRRDFRLHDNPAFFAAVEYAKTNNLPFLPLFILDDNILGTTATHPNIGYPRRLFLSRVLASFASQIQHFCIFTGLTNTVFSTLSQNYELYVFANNDIEPFSKQRDTNIAQIIQKTNGKFFYFSDQITINSAITSGSGNIYSVFTPFKKAVWNEFLEASITQTVDVQNVSKLSTISLHLPQIQASSSQNLQQAIFSHIDVPWVFFVDGVKYNVDEILPRSSYSHFSWREDEVQEQFEHFLTTNLPFYKENRDNLSLNAETGQGTGNISVALKWGLISGRWVKQRIINHYGKPGSDQFNFLPESTKISIETYISQLIWREFYKYILHNHSKVLTENFQKKYQENEPKWEESVTADARFKAWIQGKTGYLLVDAAMKQIAKTGWMHNRARMVVASILTKNLGVNWRWGQEYFRAILLDLDEANNNGGWQWAASVGVDPKPIRIFNPYLQQRYDPNGSYVKRWLGEIPETTTPLIEHEIAREEAKKRYGLG